MSLINLKVVPTSDNSIKNVPDLKVGDFLLCHTSLLTSVTKTLVARKGSRYRIMKVEGPKMTIYNENGRTHIITYANYKKWFVYIKYNKI